MTLARLIELYRKGDGRTGPVWIGHGQTSASGGTGMVYRSTIEDTLTEALDLLGVPWERSR